MSPVLLYKVSFETHNYFILYLGITMLYGISAEAADSLGDPFDGNALQNPNWKWKTSDEEGVEPKAWDMGKTKAGMASRHR